MKSAPESFTMSGRRRREHRKQKFSPTLSRELKQYPMLV